MTFSRNQREIIKDIVRFNIDGTEILFKELFETILEKRFKGFSIIMKKDSIYIQSEKIIEDKIKLYELFFFN